jgi:uncharacterized membrane protein YqiK
VPVELITTIVGALALVVVAALFVRGAKVRVPPGGALVIYGSGREPRVTFSDALVLPIVARAEAIDCTTKTIPVVREGPNALRCSDDLKIDVRAEVRIAVNPTSDDVLKVMRSVGARAGDTTVLRDLFEAKFADSLATVVRLHSFDDVTQMREQLRERTIEVIGTDLGGWVLQDLAFVRLEQVPVEQLDPNNILDAKAIRVIQERVASEQRRVHDIQTAMKREEIQRQLAERELALEVERLGR